MDFLIAFDNVASVVALIAGLIGSITVVGSALIWVYKQLIARPKERRDAVRVERENEKFRKAMQPTIDAVEQISRGLAYQEERDEKLQQIADTNVKLLEKHENRLDLHEQRIIVLETKNGIPVYFDRGDNNETNK
ncbi:hypothetical protein ACRCJU_02950 [Aerococcus urinaeequi]|uniref:hypothetical protein n=1 Tax=Aerococcus urinaeequi TaxID=51665 RepID=UPI003D6B0F58